MKFVTAVGLVLLGMFYLERRILANLALLETREAAALQDPVFLAHVRELKAAMFIPLVAFIALIAISVLKPWGLTRRASTAAG